MKKLFPVLLLVLLALLTLVIKRCNQPERRINTGTTVNETRGKNNYNQRPTRNTNANGKFNRDITNLFFTRHAKCRMKCRQITQQEVKDILTTGTINYNKSNLNDPKGATYALEGNTDDDQHVRIIFAPKQKHMSVVTVIDLENEYECNCN